MPISAERIRHRLERLSEYGRTASGGVTRLSWTEPYWEAAELVESWMREAGMGPRRDAIGNLIARREGRRPSSSAIMLGSHLDSVLEGGHYDGAAGVVCALEVAQATLEDEISLEHALEVVAFVEEEGTRFSYGMLGSQAMLGALSPDVFQRRGLEGRFLADLLRSAGLEPDKVLEATRSKDGIAAYLELHIEQGAVLEEAGHAVGIVTGIVGLLGLSLKLVGRADHAGGTPMHLRRDALVGAAELVLAVERVARQRGPTAVGTVGRIEARPGQFNIIPGESTLTIDLRDIDATVCDTMETELRDEIRRVSDSRGLRAEVHEMSRQSPVSMHPVVLQTLTEVCARLGLPAHRLPSGAGHDAQIMARAVPAGMVFVRCRQGISHSPAEHASADDLAAGTQVLYRAVLDLDDKL